MKKNIIKLALLVLGTTLSLWFTQCFIISTMKNCTSGTIGKINAVMRHQIDVEVSIWGASTAYVNINPKIMIDTLHQSVINMGIDGTNIDQYAGLLHEYLDYTKKTKRLIIALDLHGGLEERNSFYHLHNWLHHTNNQHIFNCLSDIDYQTMNKLKYVPFYSLTLFDKHAFPYFRKSLFNPHKEFDFKNRGFSPAGNMSITNQIDTTITASINARPIKKLTALLSKAKHKNIMTYLVITPCYIKGLSQIKNSKDFISTVKTFACENVKVLDFSNCSISKGATLFKDNTHLNSRGADEFTRLLSHELALH